MAGAAADLADAASQASHTVDRQQSETEQVATAMNEMAATVEEIARGAGEAAQATEQVTRQASGGATLVGESVSGIEALASGVESAAGLVRRLAADSQSIGAVLEVIRGIAEQTNLLALNAAIEAARAGEQGRGFAVVADEVRTLAQRTQQSTREIQGSIETLQSSAADAARAMEDGQKRARASVDQIRRVAESLGKISTAVATISDLNTRMAAGAEEQSVVTNEVNRNIVNISDAGRQASQVVQRTAAASRQLSALASDMQTLTAAFKL
jgi:methyl-accepting chemotaxis protein